MKKSIPVFLLLVLLVSFCNAKDIHAAMRNCVFLSAKDSSYIETEFTIETKSLKFVKSEKDLYQATVVVTILYSQDTSIKGFYKYLLFSPPVKDASTVKFNMLDVKRIILPDGEYSVELLLKDINDTTSKGYLTDEVKTGFKKDSVSLSDIELVSEYTPAKQNSIYTKNGYDIKPHTVAYYPTAFDKLTFYAEIYNTKMAFKDNDYLVRYSINETRNNKPLDGFSAFSKQEPADEKVILSGFDISTLPTGNYFLSIEIRNDKNELITEKSLFFHRSNKNLPFNPLTLKDVTVESFFAASVSWDSIAFFVQSLYPIAGNEEVNFINSVRKSTDTLLMEKFLYSFWKQRAPQFPLESWQKYLAQVYKVENSFKTSGQHGFQTDRGRVYLQYGPPNDIAASNSEPGTLPYQIWHYYFIPPKQSNVKFVFFEQDGIVNDFRLIYSDAEGEIKDPRWKYKIMDAFKEQNGFGNIDNVNPTRDSYGSYLSELFDE